MSSALPRERAVAYWIEVCKRAYADGKSEALPYIDYLLEREATSVPYLSPGDVPCWLDRYVADHAYRDRKEGGWWDDEALERLAKG